MFSCGRLASNSGNWTIAACRLRVGTSLLLPRWKDFIVSSILAYSSHPLERMSKQKNIPLSGSGCSSSYHTSSLLLCQSTGNEDREVTLPPLSDYPLLMWPEVFKSIRNFVFNHFVIRPYMDNEFDLKEFNRGAKQALSFVSKKLASAEFDDLEGLVDPETLAEVQKRLLKFNVFQRELLKVEVDDIFFCFPYQIGIIIPDPPPEPLHRQSLRSQADGDVSETRPVQRRFVEITVVFHILRGFADKSAAGEMKSIREFIQSEDRNNVMVCNYRFFKDFTQGSKDPSWLITMINHFLPAEHQKYRN